MGVQLKQTKLSELIDYAVEENTYWTAFSFNVEYTDSNNQTANIDIITPDMFWDEMIDHFSWKLLAPYFAETDDPPTLFFYQKWVDFCDKHAQSVYDWVIDTMVKNIDPLVTGWEKVSSTRTRNNFGYTDNTARYMISNVATGYNKDITLGSGTTLASKINVGSMTQTKYTTETEGGRIGYNNTELGAKTNLSKTGNTVNASTATGTDVTTEVQTGTFNRAAQEDAPYTQKDTNKGTTTGNSADSSSSKTETSGSNYSDSYEQAEGGRTYTGSETVQTDKDASTTNILENLDYWIEHELATKLLEQFCSEVLFYCEGCDD